MRCWSITLGCAVVQRSSGKKMTAEKEEYTTDFISAGTYEWCRKNKLPLKDGTHARVGDIVICSDKAKDFTNPCDLGKVVKVVESQRLVGKKGEEHPDGPIGEIFVQTYEKQKLGSKKK